MDIVPLVGWALDGARVTARDLRPGRVAEPVWGPRGLLADLELRTGLGPRAVDEVTRVFALRARAEELARARPEVFFARSLKVDAWGTARALLALRDELVLGGWDGGAVAGLARVEALAALDALHAGGGLPFGEVDRVARVARALVSAPYPRLVLVEASEDWPGAWRRLWKRLAEVGVEVLPDVEGGGGASPRSACDLERVVHGLRAGVARGQRLEVTGDGSFIVLTAETPEPLAEAVAAVIAAERETQPRAMVAVLRTAEHGALEAALPRFGLPRLGGLRSSGVPLAGAWLPLVMALMAERFDPEAALDLLLMPESGLRRDEAQDLARALQGTPGLGAAWVATLIELGKHEQGRSDGLARVLEWVKAPEHGVTLAEIARRVSLLDKAIASRVVVHRLPPADGRRTAVGDQVSVEALEAARGAMAAWLRALPPELGATPDEAAQSAASGHVIDALLRTFGDIAASRLTQHEAGAIERVDDAAALTADVDTLVWWGFVDPGAPASSGWRDAEREALARAGVAIDAPEVQVLRRARAWRALLGRARRVILAVPGRIAGARQAPHPLWAELRGRLGWSSEEAFAAVVVTASGLAASGRLGQGERALSLPTAKPRRVAWAEASSRWGVPMNLADAARGYSVSGLEALFKCPLRFVLERRAKLYERAVGVVGAEPLWLGNLGHRLVQVLFESGHLATSRLAAMDLEGFIERLMQDEAAILYQPGRRVERKDVARKLADAMRAALAWLDAEGLAAVSVEEPIAGECGGRALIGRLDLRAVDSDGTDVIVDFKWSTRKHGEALAGERAVQLAAYAEMFRKEGRAPRGAYVGLRDGAVAPAESRLLAATWARAEALIGPLEEALGRGEILVTGTGEGLDPADELGVADGIRMDPRSVCDFCRFDLICGRSLNAAPMDDDEGGPDAG